MGYAPVYRYLAGKMDWFAAGWPRQGAQTAGPHLGELADRDVPTCAPGETMKQVRARVDAAGRDRCVVVTPDNIILGMVSDSQLQADGDLTADLVMDPGPSTFRPSITARELADWMGRKNRHHALISTADGVLIGDVERSTVEEAAHGR
jgi:alkanesulfonate monooxygenase SsuD/methylene tetrahydromethanopterin reductase-like flavin-dependent oxidoreductase (luciferase family)